VGEREKESKREREIGHVSYCKTIKKL